MRGKGFCYIPIVALVAFSGVLGVSAVKAASQANIPRGTVIRLSLKEGLSTFANRVGDSFTAEVAEDVVVENRTVIERGSIVDGSITRLDSPKRLSLFRGQASLVLRFERIRTHHGEEPVVASLVSVRDPADKNPDQKIQGEGRVSARLDLKGLLTREGVGMSGGAILGAILGNVSRGFLFGSIGGAVTILGPKGKDVVLHSGSEMVIRLDRDLAVE